MKLLLGILMVFLLAGMVYGQDINTLRQEENFLESIDQKLELEKQELISMDVKLKDLYKQGKRDEDELNSDRVSWNQEYNAFKQEVDQFNGSNRRDENWRNRLKNRENQIQQRKNNIEQRGKNLEFVSQSVKNQQQILKDRHQIWLSKHRDNEARMKAVQAKIDAYKAKQNECERLLADPNTRDEALRAGCGDMFDGGNRNLPPLSSR